MKKIHLTQRTPFSRSIFTGIVLILVIFIATILRLHHLATLPTTLNRDEAALAYNAFLLNQTGKDEWGRTWPITLESFGDYKLPGYPFLLVGFFKLFGYNDFVVRLPSAIAGIVLVLLGFLCARKVLGLGKGASLWVAATIAFQPIFFFYSRMAWEANVGLGFFVGALLLLFYAGKKARLSFRQYLLLDIGSLLLLVLAIFSYNTPLLLLPFLVMAMILQRGIKNWRRYSFPVVSLSLLFLSGIVLFSSINHQKSGITIFTDETLWQQSVNYHNSFTGVTQKLIGNRFVFFGREVATRYVQSLSPQFLVWRGGQHPWHTLPGYGHLFLATYLLFIVGILRSIWKAFSKRSLEQTRKQYQAILFLFVTSLIPAVITVDAPHATRSLFFFFLICLFSGLGIQYIWQEVSLRTTQRTTAQIFFILLLSIGLYLEIHRYYFSYFTRYPKQSAEILQAGLLPALQSVEKTTNNNQDQAAIVDPNGFLYVSVAWYLKMPPTTFFQTINHHLPDRIGLKYGYRVGQYRFIAHREDRVSEDKHLIEWNPTFNNWLIDQP